MFWRKEKNSVKDFSLKLDREFAIMEKSINDFSSKLDKDFKTIEKNIDKELVEKKSYFKSGKIEDTISDIFLNNIIDVYSGTEYEAVKNEGKRRFDNKIPPGYMDAADKEENGDYYIFKSLIDYCKKNNKGLILVTNDKKEDWFRNIRGIKEPREELLEEFYKETGNKLIIFDFDDFLSQKDIFKNELPVEAVDEIKEISEIYYNEKQYIYHKIKVILRLISEKRTFEEIATHEKFILSKIDSIIEFAYSISNNNIIKGCILLKEYLSAKQYDRYLITLDSMIDIDRKNNFVEKVSMNDVLNCYIELSDNDSIESATKLLNLMRRYIKTNEPFSSDNVNFIRSINPTTILKKSDESSDETYIDIVKSSFDSFMEKYSDKYM